MSTPWDLVSHLGDAEGIVGIGTHRFHSQVGWVQL